MFGSQVLGQSHSLAQWSKSGSLTIRLMAVENGLGVWQAPRAGMSSFLCINQSAVIVSD